MADNDDTTEKTLEPTEKRLQDARKKGDVPTSRETGSMMVILALLGLTAVALPWKLPDLTQSLSILIEKAGQIPVSVGNPGLSKLSQVVGATFFEISLALAPLFLLLFAGGLLGTLIQGPTVIAVERIKPKLSKVSPKEGLKRLFSANSLVELAKSLVKVFAVGAIALWVTSEAVRTIWQTTGFLPELLTGYIGDAARRLLIFASILIVPITIADVLWRRFDWMRKQRMSHKELKDELKESEGSPEVRTKRAKMRRELSHQRTVMVVPDATLVLTNPTHFAVALRYDPDTDAAPVCVAKGADHVARKIREIAFAHEVPIIENKPLARLLYDTADIDSVVPVEHWEIVAEIVSYVFDLEKNINRPAPEGSTLQLELT